MKHYQLKTAELQQAPLVPLVQWSAEQAVFARAVDYVKLLALLAVERAASGHPGMVLGCAPFAVALYRYILQFNGAAPHWEGRDRFILSAGHGSMLLYALHYLFGYKLTLRDLAQFRQLASATPGHPERSLKHGIETTTGPLGQGFGNAVGYALERKLFAARLRTIWAAEPAAATLQCQQQAERARLFEPSCVFVLLGDGCMMEGITQEAAALAGHLGLGNLIACYDDNNASIDGHASLAMSEDTAARFIALGWDVQVLTDGADAKALLQALAAAKARTATAEKPLLLILKTIIGAGLKSWANNPAIHGRPAGNQAIVDFLLSSSLAARVCGNKQPTQAEAAAAVKEMLVTGKFPAREDVLPQNFYDNTRGTAAYAAWDAAWTACMTAAPRWDKQLTTFYTQCPMTRAGIADNIRERLLTFNAAKPAATRALAATVLALLTAALPNLIGGSADLVASTKATVKGAAYLQRGDWSGRNIPFGVREHAMGALGNGIALGGHFLPFTSTFLVFSDYMRASIRLAALMQLKQLFIFSHDSFYVGEDGPTHQPVEQLMALRLIPGLNVCRPGTAQEVAFAFLQFIEGTGPLVIVTSRQALADELFTKQQQPVALAAAATQYANFKTGVYVLRAEADAKRLHAVLTGSGSEMGTLLTVQAELEREGYSLRVVSMPALAAAAASGAATAKLFAPTAEQCRLQGNAPVPCYFLEAGCAPAHTPFAAVHWTFRTLEHFGSSAPAAALAKKFNFTPQQVAADIKQRCLPSTP